MADPTNLILMVIHLTAAATAFAVGMTMSGAIRRASGESRDVKLAIARLANRSGLIASIFGLVTLLSGFALIFYRGGFKAVSPTIHVAITLVLIMLAIGQLLQRPTGTKLLGAVDDPDAWNAARKRWVMADGIQQLLWLVTLVLMFIKRGA
jgi:hypothetical protein